jgi:hypothetical protein
MQAICSLQALHAVLVGAAVFPAAELKLLVYSACNYSQMKKTTDNLLLCTTAGE